jgi:hypothetical protein
LLSFPWEQKKATYFRLLVGAAAVLRFDPSFFDPSFFAARSRIPHGHPVLLILSA